MENNIILSIKHLGVSFKSHGKDVHVIRNISLDVKKGETLAIVGESGSGKSVFTKTFMGMLESNGRIKNGTITLKGISLEKDQEDKNVAIKKLKTEKLVLFRDGLIYDDIADKKGEKFKRKIAYLNYCESFEQKQLQDYLQVHQNLTSEKIKAKEESLNKKKEKYESKKAKLVSKFNNIKDKVLSNKSAEAKIDYLKKIGKTFNEEEIKQKFIQRTDVYQSKINYLQIKYDKKLERSENKRKRIIEKENKTPNFFTKLVSKVNLSILDGLKKKEAVEGDVCHLEKFKTNKEWSLIRGKHIGTIFQDPMTSLNPLLTIGTQISEALMLHHHLSKREAKIEAINLLKKVKIPQAEERYNDYPFQYSGGMRQRVVIAIALACRPDILICDEPTTALDVTVQAQILKLIKSLQIEYGFTTIFITHDLGVVAGIADRVAVMYGGEIVEVGTADEVFYDPAHPYTWALLSSLPQLATEGQPLTYIKGNPPTFDQEIQGDAFAPRNVYALKIDHLVEAPMTKISETHWAKTWLLDERAPKVEKPITIQNLSKRMKEVADQLKTNGGND